MILVEYLKEKGFKKDNITDYIKEINNNKLE